MVSFRAASPTRRNESLSTSVPTFGLLLAMCTFGVVHAQTHSDPPVTPGFPNVTQVPGALLSGLNEPNQGRLAIIAYNNGVLFTLPEVPGSQPGSDHLARAWDINDPTNPAVTEVLGETPMPINAHGYLKIDNELILGRNGTPPWTFAPTPTPGTYTRKSFDGPWHRGFGTRGMLAYPWFVGETWWSYGDIGGNAFIEIGWNRVAEWDHLGQTGVIGHPIVIGDLLIFAGDQSRTGVATYDIGDPENPVLLDVLTDGGPGGYWPEVWGGGGKLYLVFPYNENGNGFRVVDATDPADLQFVTDVPLGGDSAMYAQFQDEYAFIGDHKIDMRTFQSVLDLDGANTPRPGGGTGVSTSQFALPLGNLLVTGGIGSNQGMAIWAHQAEPDTRGPEVGFHIPRSGATGVSTRTHISLLIHETLESSTFINGDTFIVRPLGGAPIDGTLTFTFNDILSFAPDQPLQSDTTYEVIVPDGGIKDAAGNGIVGLSFSFSTGSSVGGNQPPEIDGFTATPYPVGLGQTASFSVSASDPEAGTLEYRFDFGDGSPQTSWSGSSTAQHVYSAAGHYRATVQVRDSAEAMATRTTTVTALDVAAGPDPTSSGPIFCDNVARRVWTVNPDNDTVTIVDADTLQVLDEISVCRDPRAIARSAASGEVWVTCHDDDRIFVLDGSGNFVREIELGYGSAPQGIAFDPAGNNAFVALESRGEVVRFSATDYQERARSAPGPRPRGVAVLPDGTELLVTRFISPDERAEVWRLDAEALAVSDTLTVRKFGGELNRDSTAAGRGTANYLTGIAVDPGGRRAWVPGNKPNFERGLFFVEALDSDNTVRNVVARLDLTGSGSPNGHRYRQQRLGFGGRFLTARRLPVGDAAGQR